MTKERTEKLEEFDFEWVLVEKNGHDTTREDLLWLAKYEELKAFKERYGHCMVSVSDPRYKSLGLWVGVERRNKGDNSISKNRQEWLDEIGFVWKIDFADATKSRHQM